MAAAHDSVGALAAGANSPVAPTIPNTTAGVFAIVAVCSRANTGFTINSDDGSWVNIVEQAQNNLSYIVAYRRLTGGDANPSVAADAGTGGNGIFGYVMCATGILTSGSPLDAAATQNNVQSGTTSVATGLNTTTNGALLYNIHFANNDTVGAGGFSNPLRSGGTPTAVASGNGYESTVGSDCTMGSAVEVIASAGATGDVTMDLPITLTNHGVLVALTPEPAGGAAISIASIIQNYRNMGLA